MVHRLGLGCGWPVVFGVEAWGKNPNADSGPPPSVMPCSSVRAPGCPRRWLVSASSPGIFMRRQEQKQGPAYFSQAGPAATSLLRSIAEGEYNRQQLQSKRHTCFYQLKIAFSCVRLALETACDAFPRLACFRRCLERCNGGRLLQARFRSARLTNWANFRRHSRSRRDFFSLSEKGAARHELQSGPRESRRADQARRAGPYCLSWLPACWSLRHRPIPPGKWQAWEKKKKFSSAVLVMAGSIM
jgi:hypothetical protein